MRPEYADRVVAFIDVLGFGALVRQLDSDPSLHAKLHRALSKIRVFKHYSLQEATAQADLEVSVFSDSIVISGATGNFHGVIFSALHLQCNLLEMGILVRGGISSGRTVHADDILYGEGMLDAYMLEATAVYPRIVLAPKLVEKLEPGYRAMFLEKDGDGLWFINPFSIGLTPADADELAADGYSPFEESLKTLGERIDLELSRLSEVGQLAKWNWLKRQHSIALVEFAKLGDPRFWHAWREAERAKKVSEE
jgi:hypothetical protein